MQKSETIGELAKGLALAQGKIKGAVKDSENPFFKSKYADLASVWDACREALSQNGIAIIQTPRSDIAESHTIISVGTLLIHSSGEWVSEELSAVPVKEDPQGIGSCITYLRRYALSAFTGVAPEDDDGNAASQSATPTQQARRGREGQKPPPFVDAEREALMLAIKDGAKLLNGLGDTPPWTAKRCNEFANENFNIKSGVDGLTNPQLSEMAKLLSARIDRLKASDGNRTEIERKAKLATIQANHPAEVINIAINEFYPNKEIDSLTLDELVELSGQLEAFQKGKTNVHA